MIRPTYIGCTFVQPIIVGILYIVFNILNKQKC